MSQTQRIVFIDYLKAFAIFLVLLGHAIQYINVDSYLDSLAFNFIYSFHMPLFMFISGMFFKSSLQISFKELIKKKFVALILPALVWSLHKIAYAIIIHDIPQMADVVIYNLWFLKSVFLCYIIGFILFKLLPSSYAYTVAILLSILLPMTALPGYINMMLPYFIGGGIVKDNLEKIVKNVKILIVSGILFIILFYFWDFKYNHYENIIVFTGGFNIEWNHLFVYLYRLAIGFAGCCFFLVLFSFIKFSKFNSIKNIGQQTLPIYAMNMFFCDILMRLVLPTYSELILSLIIVAVTFVQIPVYLLIICFLNRYNITSILFLGKRPN